MKLNTLILATASVLLCACNSVDQPAEQSNYIRYVDPFIGTGGIVHTFPGATTPFGMVQLSPDGDTKGWNWCSGYHASDSTIKGFSHNHLSGTGWADLGDILVMATTGEVRTNAGAKDRPQDGYRSRIDHSAENEEASAGYYRVNLLDYGIKAEMTATPRVGIHRYTFPESDSSNIIIDPTNKIFGQVFNTEVNVVNDSTIQGSCYSDGWGGKRNVYFTAIFSKPFLSAGVSADDRVVAGEKRHSGKDSKAFATFRTSKDEPITVKVAISAVDMAGAENNMKSEAATITFDQARVAAEKMWEDELSKFRFDGVDEQQMKILYTGLYHSMVQPNLSMDADGRYVANGKEWKADGFKNYSTFSFWDTFRAVHPLFTITNHAITADVVNSLISRHKNGGQLPMWELLGWDNTCMIGYPAVAVMADAITKGVPGINVREAYQAMRAIAFFPKTSSSDGESGIDEYIRFGYVPAGIPASVAKTAEYSYYDWCIAQVAEMLGEKEDAEMFNKRSRNFLNHWNPEIGMLMPKDSLGNWVSVSFTDWESLRPHYVSGNIWAYSYFYPHATSLMIDAMGGAEAFEKSMDNILNTPMNMEGEQHVDISGFIGYYGHGDEPGHQFLYLYNNAGAAWKIAPRLHEVSKEYYSTRRDGMPNNDDCGQMSVWYIFSSMGFYPVSPGDKNYVIGAPMMNGATIRTASGKDFVMKAHGLSPDNIHVQSVTLNGQPLERGYITHDEIMNGSTLEFQMGNSPNKELFVNAPAKSALQ